MFAVRNIARASRKVPVARLGATRTLPLLSRPTVRSFWDQKQSEQMKYGKKSGQPAPNARKDQPPPDSEYAEMDFTEVESAPYFSPWFMGMLALGVGLVSYGLYGLYEMMTLWPVEIRQDLRSGLRAKRKGDWDIAIQYLTRAWNEARTVPRSTFGEQALLKVSGIGIALAGVVEESGQTERAYEVYQDVLQYLRTAHLGLNVSKDVNVESDILQAPLSGPERMRTVALAYKLGELANALKKTEEEEKWLVLSVETILRLIDSPPRGVPGLHLVDKHGPSVQALVEQLGLPAIFVRYNIAAPFEALGSFYSRNGNPTYALPLYLQAISILIPPSPAVSDIEDRCRGAALMGNIAELITRYQVKNDKSSEAIFQAEAWAKKGLDLVNAARKASPTKCETCEEAYAVLLYNLAMVRELSGDENRARQLLNESLEHSKAMGLDEGIKQANGALDALGAQAAEPAVKSLVTDTDIAAAAALE